MKIKIDRTGGFSGIPSSSEMTIDKLPASLEGTIKELIAGSKPPVANSPRPPKGSADYLNYKITIQNGTKNHVVELSEPELSTNLRSLITYVQKNSEK